MRGNTSTRQRSFRPSHQSTYEPRDARKRGGVSSPHCALRASRGNSIALGSAHPCSRCSLSSSTFLTCGQRIRLTAPVLESPLVNGAHVLPPHSILQNFLFERARRDRRVTSLILHALRPILDSPLVNSVSLLGPRYQVAPSRLSCGQRIRLTAVHERFFPGPRR